MTSIDRRAALSFGGAFAVAQTFGGPASANWFAPPRDLQTRLLTRLPDPMRLREKSEWVEFNRGGAPTDVFLEGACFDSAGRLYMVDLAFGRIFRVTNGEWETVVRYDGWPNGMKVLSDGMLIVTDYKRGLIRIDPSNGAITPILSLRVGEGFKGLNDLVLHQDGSAFFTDQGQTGLQDPTGRVYRLRPDGRLDKLIDTGPSPNGIALNAAQNQLYIAMTRAASVWRFALGRDANVVKAQNFVQMPGGTIGPDGLAVDNQDRLYICDPGHESVWVTTPSAEPLYRIRCPARSLPTNCAFTNDWKTLVITDSFNGNVLACDTPM